MLTSKGEAVSESEVRLVILRKGVAEERKRCLAAAAAVRDYYQGEADAACAEKRYGDALLNQVRADAAGAVVAAIRRERGES